MNISSSIVYARDKHDVIVRTNDVSKSITVPSKPDGNGLGVNGGEFLCLALATCFCNDIYREAAKRKMIIDSIEVVVSGVFGKEGEPATAISYRTEVKSEHTEKEIRDLIGYVNEIAEVHNTLRRGIAVTLEK
jgi:uncharacterized OsmC-like protein